MGRIEQIVTMLLEKLRIESLAFGDGEDLQNKEVFVGLYKRENRKSRYLYLDMTIDRRRYRLSTRCENKRDAEKVKYLLLSRLLKVPSTPEERERRAPTVTELSKRYLEECCRGKPSYNRQALNHANIVRAFGNRRVDTITPEVVHRWMRQERLRIGRYGRPIASRTVDMDRGYLHRVYEFGRKICGLKMDNPVANVKPFAEYNKRSRILRDEEQEILLNACSFEWLKDVISFTLGTGLRIGEVASLQKSWFVLDTAVPHFKVPREKGKVTTEFPLISGKLTRIVEKYCRTHPECPAFFVDEQGRPLLYYRIEG
ncbi:MAG TPA: hypothetical protein P5184_04920, partial [Bacteroidales bacterium]|nr:hypothetical protein [Bacteroidales bacterium]